MFENISINDVESGRVCVQKAITGAPRCESLGITDFRDKK